MKWMIKKFGKYNSTAFVIMGVGVILFLVTPLLLWLFNFDSDIIGAFVFILGLLMWVIGLVFRRNKRNRPAIK